LEQIQRAVSAHEKKMKIPTSHHHHHYGEVVEVSEGN